MVNTTNNCPNRAEYLVPWAGKIMRYCEIHANGMATLAQVIGSPMQIEKIIPQGNCQGPNDLEEYQQAKDEQKTK